MQENSGTVTPNPTPFRSTAMAIVTLLTQLPHRLDSMDIEPLPENQPFSILYRILASLPIEKAAVPSVSPLLKGHHRSPPVLPEFKPPGIFLSSPRPHLFLALCTLQHCLPSLSRQLVPNTHSLAVSPEHAPTPSFACLELIQLPL